MNPFQFDFCGNNIEEAEMQGDSLVLRRDPLGLKPLFFAVAGERLVIARDVRTLLQNGVPGRLDADGIGELIALGPARAPHSGVLAGIHALPPGHMLTAGETAGILHIECSRYWDFATHRMHTDSETATIAHIRKLLIDAVHKFVAKVFEEGAPGRLCSFLSGGLDSSFVTAVAAAEYKRRGERLTTLSFDFVDSDNYFVGSSFQPDLDKHWVAKMVEFCDTDHHYIECSAEDLANSLLPAVNARGLPGMADVDASLLYFCANRPPGIDYALTGECADEIFGGYPWFDPGFSARDDFFPWSGDIFTRAAVLKDEWAAQIPQIIAAHTAKTLNVGDILTRRQYLTLKWFMPTLTDRMYYMGAYSGLSGLLPFADLALAEYVWNIPWALKRKRGTVKYLLKEAARGILPDEVIDRKKSPFPKTYDPAYLQIVARRLRGVIERGGTLFEFVERDKLAKFITETEAAPHKNPPWFGQLMQAPQMLAYLLQVDYFCSRYPVEKQNRPAV